MESKFEVVSIAQFKPGLFLKGKKTGESGKQIKLTDKKSGRDYFKYIHQFAIVDCSDDMQFMARNEQTRSYEPVTPMPGAKVAIWATKSLHEKLEMFPEGTILRVEEGNSEESKGDFKKRKFDIKMEKA